MQKRMWIYHRLLLSCRQQHTKDTSSLPPFIECRVTVNIQFAPSDEIIHGSPSPTESASEIHLPDPLCISIDFGGNIIAMLGEVFYKGHNNLHFPLAIV